MKVSICVITFRRPDGLRKVLCGLQGQVFHRTKSISFEVVVVDNDDRGEATSICAEISPPFPLRCCTEPRRGIPFARNRGVQEADEAAEFIAFIDDDECPAPHWLEELCAVQQAHDADVVTGPVLPVYPDAAPAWLVKGGFFERPRHPNGASIDYARSGNVLIRRAVLPAEGPFNILMPMTGGTDTLLFMELQQAGCSFFWADCAVVHEDVPPQRMTARWILRRSFRLGNALALCDMMTGLSFHKVNLRIGKGVARVLLGLGTIPMALLHGRRAALQSSGNIARGLGMITGIMGFRFEEYRNPR